MDYLISKIKHILSNFGLDEFNLNHFLTLVFSLLGVLIIELFAVGWKDSSLKRILRINKSGISDVVSFGIEAFNLFQILAFICCLGLFFKLNGYFQQHAQFRLIGSIPNEYLQFGIVFVLGDFKSYFRHFVFHKVKFLWELHAFHHSATAFNVFTRYRGHFLEGSVSVLFEIFPFILIGVPVQTYFVFKIVTEAHQLLLHSAVQSDWGFVGRYILVSPACHRVHHSIDDRHYNKNMGVSLIIWDRIFGTYHPAQQIKKLGVKNSPHNKKGYLYDVYISAKDSALSLFSSLKNLAGNKR